MFARKPSLKPGERVILCPQCGTDFPGLPLVQLASFVIRNGKLVGVITGQRVGCVACGHTYELDGRGVRHVPRQQEVPPVPNGASHDERGKERERWKTEEAMKAIGPMVPARKPPG